MTTQYTTLEIWVAVDEAGDWEAAGDSDTARERYRETFSEDPAGMRMVKLVVKVPLPTPIVLIGEVVADEFESGLKAA